MIINQYALKNVVAQKEVASRKISILIASNQKFASDSSKPWRKILASLFKKERNGEVVQVHFKPDLQFVVKKRRINLWANHNLWYKSETIGLERLKTILMS